MMIKTLRTGLVLAAGVAALSAIAPATASANGFHSGFHVVGGHYYYGGHWRARYWAPRYWGGGIVLRNGCPYGYVRDGDLCYPTF